MKLRSIFTLVLLSLVTSHAASKQSVSTTKGASIHSTGKVVTSTPVDKPEWSNRAAKNELLHAEKSRQHAQINKLKQSPKPDSIAVMGKAAKSPERQSQSNQTQGQRLISGTDKPAAKDLTKPLLVRKPKLRAQSPEKSNASYYFEIFDAWSFLNTDIDGDGYFSEFTIEFDADTGYAWADVFADLYISRNGGPWEYYFTTEVFEIRGARSNDVYSVTTRLEEAFPTGSYDILIDLYEFGVPGVVATLSSVEDIDLFDLPLEDYWLDTQTLSGFYMYDVRTTLLRDRDGDGFASEFAIEFDADTDYAFADVYAEIYFLNEQGVWELDYASDVFTLEGNSVLDTQIVELEWLSGYPTNYYDFKIVIADALSDVVLVETFSEFVDLNAVPLESVDRDEVVGRAPPPVDQGGITTSVGRGGGALSWVLMLGLLAGLTSFRKRSTNV